MGRGFKSFLVQACVHSIVRCGSDFLGFFLKDLQGWWQPKLPAPCFTSELLGSAWTSSVSWPLFPLLLRNADVLGLDRGRGSATSPASWHLHRHCSHPDHPEGPPRMIKVCFSLQTQLDAGLWVEGWSLPSVWGWECCWCSPGSCQGTSWLMSQQEPQTLSHRTSPQLVGLSQISQNDWAGRDLQVHRVQPIQL